MRTALAVVCSFTLCAVAYLSLSVLIFRPPGVNDQESLLLAVLFVGVSVLTLAGLAGISGAWIRWPLVAGGLAIIWAGAAAVRATLAGPHFEGYALVLGSVLVAQGALTFAVFGPPSSSAFGRTSVSGGRQVVKPAPLP